MESIIVAVRISAPVEKAWRYFNDPEHVTKWNHASDDWHSPRAQNDLRPGGIFNYRMESKDGSEGFDFTGTYSEIVPLEKIAYVMLGGRKVTVTFKEEGESTVVTTTFDPETQNPPDMQRAGWQAILDNFKKHAEEH